MSLYRGDRRRTRCLALGALVAISPHAAPGERGAGKPVAVLCPQNNGGSPGHALADRAVRATQTSAGNGRIGVYAEYFDVSRRRGDGGRRAQLDRPRRKSAGRKVDLVIAGLSSGRTFAPERRDTTFPGAHCAVGRRELTEHNLRTDAAGAPVATDLAGTLDVLNQGPAESTARYAEQVKEMSVYVKKLSSSIHDLSHQFHPSKLEQLGLIAAVRSLCRELALGHGLAIDFSHRSVPRAVPADTALCLYRIVQEALRNTVKHSTAQHARVQMIGGGDALRLQVSDDGNGFAPESVDRNGGLGLVSMWERLRLVGGTITIDSPLSVGTRIEVRVPHGTRPEPDRSSRQAGDGPDPATAHLPAAEVFQ